MVFRSKVATNWCKSNLQLGVRTHMCVCVFARAAARVCIDTNPSIGTPLSCNVSKSYLPLSISAVDAAAPRALNHAMLRP